MRAFALVFVLSSSGWSINLSATNGLIADPPKASTFTNARGSMSTVFSATFGGSATPVQASGNGYAGCGAGSSFCDFAYASDVTAGNLLILGIDTNAQTTNTITTTGSGCASSTFALRQSYTATNPTAALRTAISSGNGPCSVRVTLDAAWTSAIGMGLAEVACSPGPCAYDAGSISNAASGTNTVTATAATSRGGEYAFAYWADGSSTVTSSGWANAYTPSAFDGALYLNGVASNTTVSAAFAGFTGASTVALITISPGSNSSTINSLSDLQAAFDPYGISGQTVIGSQWQIFPFSTYPGTFTTSPANVVMGTNEFNMVGTATALSPGNINSGQIASKATYQPGISGQNVRYAIQARLKVPPGVGMWPAFWLFSKNPAGGADASEVDMFEQFNNLTNGQNGCTGGPDSGVKFLTPNLHGPGAGSVLYTNLNACGSYYTNTDWSAAYHNYQLLWTNDVAYVYVDDTLMVAYKFKWTSIYPAQFLLSHQIGTSAGGIPGVQPTSLLQFPVNFGVQSISVWGQ